MSNKIELIRGDVLKDNTKNNLKDDSNNDIEQDTKKNKFNKLTPEFIDVNSGYSEALDFALAEDDIRNIAISGIYASGKSTVWKSYAKDLKKNIISVALGEYKSENKTEDKNIENEDRIEKQIINQILL